MARKSCFALFAAIRITKNFVKRGIYVRRINSLHIKQQLQKNSAALFYTRKMFIDKRGRDHGHNVISFILLVQSVNLHGHNNFLLLVFIDLGTDLMAYRVIFAGLSQ